MYLNKQTLMGFLGKDPDLKTTNNGSAVASVSIATKEVWKNANGEKQEDTQWHTLVFWNKNAENVAQFCTKGSHLYVEGITKHEEYEDKQGVKRRATKVHVTMWKALDKKQGNGAPRDTNVPPSARGSRNDYDPSDDAPPSAPSSGSSYDDDIPF